MSLEKIFSFLLSLDEATSTMITIVSVVSGIIAIVGQIWTRSQQKNGSWVWGCIIVISMLVIVGTITRKNLAEIPDVVNYTYEDAQGVLSSNGFKYNLEVDKGLYVVAQKPVAGIVAPKGTKVELVTASIGSNPILVDGYTNGLKVGNIEITYKQMEVFLRERDKILEWDGKQIRNYTVSEAYIVAKSSGVEYRDYEIRDDVMIFEQIPVGIKLQLHVLLDGFEEVDKEIMISSNNAHGDTLKMDFGMVKKGVDVALATTFFVADAKKSTPMDVKYMPNVKLQVAWQEKNYWSGGYRTDQDGAFEYPIFINEDRKIQVQILDPFGDGVDYECEVTLRVPVVGEPLIRDIIFLNGDGTCEAVSPEDYFMW